MPKTNRLNFIDVFSGAGGLSCGLEQAGMRCLLGVDMNKHAMESFAQNHKYADVHCGPIQELTKRRLDEILDGQTIHAVVGGPPCQGFSTVGIGNPKDERNELFLEFVRIVRLTRPYFIVMENVTGLVAKKNEKTLQNIFNRFHKLGYNLDVQVLSAQQYGVPEKRRRTIIIGTRVNDFAEFPKATHDTIIAKTHRPSVTIGDVIEDLKAKDGKVYNHCLEGAKIKNKMDEKRIARVPEGKGIRYQKDEKAYLPKSLRLDVDWEKLPEGRFRQTKYQRLDRALPSPTIMTHRHSYYHPTQNRYLTAREAAKLQSFPNDFIFAGPLSAQWRQIGNAVPPLLGKAIGKTLIKMRKNANPELLDPKKRIKPRKSKIEYIRGKAFVYKETNKQKSL